MEWTLRAVTPRDQFDNHTLTLQQWLENEREDGLGLQRTTAKLQAFMEATTLVLPYLKAQSGLRADPRIGYDPVSDCPYFLFKASNNGTTFVVSPQPLSFPPDEVIDLAKLKSAGGLLEAPPAGSELTPLLRTCPRCMRVGHVYLTPRIVNGERKANFTIIWAPRNESDPRGGQASKAEEGVTLDELLSPTFGCGYDSAATVAIDLDAAPPRNKSRPKNI